MIPSQMKSGSFSWASFLRSRPFCVAVMSVSLPWAGTGSEHLLGSLSTQLSDRHKEGAGQKPVTELNEQLGERVCRAGPVRLPPPTAGPARLEAPFPDECFPVLPIFVCL